MSQWRRKALELVPDRESLVRHAFSIYDLWSDLRAELVAAYTASPPNAPLIEQIWCFAEWCFAPERHRSVRNCVAVSFYEHLPHDRPARKDMLRRLTPDQFQELLPAFDTTLDAVELETLQREFRALRRASQAAT